MTWDGSVLKLYVNGNVEATASVGTKTIVYSDDNAGIGNYSFSYYVNNGRANR